MNLPILSLITFTPLLGAIVLAVIPSHQVKLIRRVALGFALVAWVMSLALLAAFAFQPAQAPRPASSIPPMNWMPCCQRDCSRWRPGVAGVITKPP